MDTKVENIVSAITIGKKIDLKSFTKIASGIEYNPNKFPGAVFRIREPKLAMLIFSSGKVICTGARSRKDINIAVDNLINKLKEARIRVKNKPTVEIQNIVASTSVDLKVNLDILATECSNTEYEPEQFPGLVFRLDEPKTVMLIFSSGKIIITGAKNTEDIRLSAEKTRDAIKEYNAVI